jgi:hypothetical protein
VTLRNRVPRRGKRKPPIDVIRGDIIETWICFQVHINGRIETRDYVTQINGRTIASCELTRQDDDRRAWEQHWRTRRQLRHKR